MLGAPARAKRAASSGGGGRAKRPERKRAEPTRVQPQRVSARLQGVKAEDARETYAEQVQADRQREQASRRARHEDLDLEALTGRELDEQEKNELLDALAVGGSVQPAPPKTELEKTLRSMTLRSQGKVTQKRIYSMLYHPTPDKDLVFTGDQEGVLGVWTPLARGEQAEEGELPEGSAFQLQVHGRSAIGCLRLDPVQPERLYSSSYDASVRLFSLADNTSVEVWPGQDDVQLGEFDILAPRTSAAHATPTPAPQLGERSLWLPDHRGGLIHLDLRDRANVKAARWQASEKKIGGMAVNPAVPHCIAAASNDRTVRLFDVRMLRNVAETPLAPFKLGEEDAERTAELHRAARLGEREYKMACTSVSFNPGGDRLGTWRIRQRRLTSSERVLRRHPDEYVAERYAAN